MIFLVEMKMPQETISPNLIGGLAICMRRFLLFFTIDELLLPRYSWQAFKN
jgi:hypothetical protein